MFHINPYYYWFLFSYHFPFLCDNFFQFLLVPQELKELDHDDLSSDSSILICFLSSASVTLYLLVDDPSFGLAFESSSYEFSLEEDKAPGSAVGSVQALSGNTDVQVGYSLKSHWDKFSIGDQGDIVALVRLDREEGDLYSILVQAVDSLVPPNTAVALVWNMHFKIFFLKECEISLKILIIE